MNVLDHLGCDKVFYYFEAISDIPHGSFHEKELSDYIVAFAKESSLGSVTGCLSVDSLCYDYICS